MKLSEIDFIGYDIHLARWTLIKARIAREKATIEKEFDLMYPGSITPGEQAKALLAEAKKLRLEAQELLRNVEKLNGARYLAGEQTFPLKDYLKGSFFRAWKEFDYEYSKIGAPFFGSDPE